MKLHLGKKPAVYDHRDLLMAKYLDMSRLPPIPAQFGHEDQIADWGMLGNSDYGCCVLSGSAHETMLFTAVGSPTTARFDDASVLSDYSALTGFSATDPASDQGTDMHAAMKYRRNTGVIDADGKRHQIGCYIWLEPGNLDHLKAAVYLFGAVGVGVQFPNSAMDQFDQGKPWSPVGGAVIEGGHYIPIIANRKNLLCVTWGRTQEMTSEFYRRYNDESAAMISLEYLVGRKTVDGIDLRELVKDIELLR